jgi:hypothetical protein
LGAGFYDVIIKASAIFKLLLKATIPNTLLLLWTVKCIFEPSQALAVARASFDIDKGIMDSMRPLTRTTAPSLSRALYHLSAAIFPPACTHKRPCRYRIQSHPFLKRDKDTRPLHPVSPATKNSPESLPRVHVQGQFGHSVDLDQTLVTNRGDIVQKYASVTKQRGFLGAWELQELHEEHRQRKLQLPFPNPTPPSLDRLSLLGDASRKAALYSIQCVEAHCLCIRVSYEFWDLMRFLSK